MWFNAFTRSYEARVPQPRHRFLHPPWRAAVGPQEPAAGVELNSPGLGQSIPRPMSQEPSDHDESAERRSVNRSVNDAQPR